MEFKEQYLENVIPHHGIDNNRHYHWKDEERHSQLRKERETGKNVPRIKISFLQPEINSECEESYQDGEGMR